MTDNTKKKPSSDILKSTDENFMELNFSDVDAPLSLSGHIQGRVTAIDGITPLKDISVTAYRYMSMKMGLGLFNRYSEKIASVKTDLDGSYDIGCLISGKYRIGFNDHMKEYSTQYYNNESHVRLAQEINVIAGDVKTGINASLNTAITNIDISLLVAEQFEESEEFEESIQDMEDIYERIFNKNSGNPEKSEAELSACNIESYDAAQDKDRLALSGHIKGNIFDISGKEITNGFTTIYTLRWNGSEWADFNYEVVDSSSYDIRGLPDGIYRVLFKNELPSKYSCQYYNRQKALELADDIHIKAGKTVGGIDAYLSPKGVVKGKVTKPDGITPLECIVVSAYSWNGYDWDCGDYTVTTDKNGKYTVEGIDSKICRIEFMDYDSGRYGTQFYNNKNIFESADDIVIPAGSSNILTNINASLFPAGMIEGTVTGIDGITPIKNMTIDVFYNNGSRWRVCDDYSGTNITDSEGHYKIIGLAPNTYRLIFSNIGEFYNKKSSVDSADDIVVAAGETIVINASLNPEASKPTRLSNQFKSNI